ncbi:MAG: 2TM domain-containing protein [Candidatus Eisenbacteria bacterium]
MEDQERYERAKKRVQEIKGFYSHLITYVLVNALLFLIDLLSRDGHWWFYWPMLGWGIGLVAHGLSVFGILGLFGPGWEEKKIRELMEKDRRP